MSNIKCIIVEDEPLAAKVLSEYILQVPFLELQGTFKDAILATDYLRHSNTDLIFLDIHLPKLKGMAFLKTLIHSPAVIITTAYHQYAVEGFDLNVTDYLLKPFEFERFLIAVTKVKILFSEIVYIESQREYVKIVTIKNEYISKLSTHEIESLLPTNLFKRIHRSFIVSVSKINSYTAEEVEVNGVPIPIGRGYRDIIENL